MIKVCSICVKFMSNQLIDSNVILYLTSDGQMGAAVQALQRLEKRPLMLAAVFESQEQADSFLESVSRNLLFDVRHPFELTDQIDPSDLIDLMVGEIKSCVGE